MKFLIGPVRQLEEQTPEIKMIMNDLLNDTTIYAPGRDTNQIDDTGLRICTDNKNAIIKSDEVLFVWDGKSEGCLFDLGMAFALGKKVTIIHVPPLSEKKSFQNMATAYAATFKSKE